MPALGIRAYELARQKAQQAIRCPLCNIEMESREYAHCSQIQIDVCPDCHGIWLDKGELEELEIFFERSHVETSDIRRAFFAGLRLLHLK